MSGSYRVIYADPPWKFKTHSHKGLGRSAEAWYDCLSVEDICKMPIHELADRHCILFLWTTDPFLKQSFKVIKSWGFTYKTVGFYWIKEPTTWFGTGYWGRANPEQCLLATRGQPRRASASVPKLVIAPRREHSRKPDEVRQRIEMLCGKGPYIELFARERTPGWDSLGDEADSGMPLIRRWKANSYPTIPALSPAPALELRSLLDPRTGA